MALAAKPACVGWDEEEVEGVKEKRVDMGDSWQEASGAASPTVEGSGAAVRASRG